MAKAGLLFVGTDDGIVLFSDPGGVGRWLRIGQELRGQVVRAVWPATDTPLIVLAAVEGAGLQRSQDGGQSWQQALDVDVGSLAGHPRDPQALYLGTTGGDIYRSRDDGATWEPCPQGARPSAGVSCLVVPADPAQRLYAGLQAGGVWASNDGGASWAAYGLDLPAGAVGSLAGAPDGLYALVDGALYGCAGEEARWQPITTGAEPGIALTVLGGKEPVLLLAQPSAIARSADGGGSWANAISDVGWEAGLTTIAAARYHIDTAFAGSGGQLAQSSNRGRSWQILKQGLPAIRSISAARLA